jgi:hypothetical protein
MTDFVGVETQKRESLDDIMLSAILVSSEWIRRQSLEPSTQNHGIGSFSIAGVPGTRDSWYEGQFLTKNRLGLRFANFANHMFPFKLFHVSL